MILLSKSILIHVFIARLDLSITPMSNGTGYTFWIYKLHPPVYRFRKMFQTKGVTTEFRVRMKKVIWLSAYVYRAQFAPTTASIDDRG